MRNPVLKRLGISLEEHRQAVRASMAPHRLEILEQQAMWIRRAESRVLRHFTRGDAVDIARIQPTLELVTTKEQQAIWRYCRLWGAIPYNFGCGRRLRYLLRDVGQPGAPVMGIIGLSSPILVNKPRDSWIGWEYPRDVERKRRRLLCCMDMNVSMAVAPYNQLTAGKMICLAAVSDEVRQDYAARYAEVETPSGMREGRLALVTTTSLYGSSVQYNRLRIGGDLAYRPVGYTSGHGNAHLTEATFAEMESFLIASGRAVPKGWGTGRSYRMRVLTAYRRQRRDDAQARPHEQARSVYVAPLAANTQAFLREEADDLDWYERPIARLADDWRDRWLAARLANSEVMARFRAADPFRELLSGELKPIANLA